MTVMPAFAPFNDIGYNVPYMQNKGPVIDILRNRIKKCGKISFADFMDTALYHPDSGYYSSPGIKIGKEGDYYTSSSVHHVFGELICRQVEEMWKLTGTGPFVIVEMGAGNGSLCHDILRCARRDYPSFHEVLKYILIEESSRMKSAQKQMLENSGLLNDRIMWVDFTDPLFDEGVTGCFLSNEIVDAFPVHIVEKKGGELKEVFVDLSDDKLIEVLDVPSTPAIEGYFDRLRIGLIEGQRAEVNLRAVEWMRRVAAILRRGFVITIDYGYPAEDLYAPHRMSGTLLCYHRHRVVEDPFINVGEQDMTAHVDFTTLQMTGEEGGLRVAGMTDQMHFLFGLGLMERIEAIGLDAVSETEALEERLMIKNLIMPDRMGNTFKVLIQYKGFAQKPELSGLKRDAFG